MSDVTIYDDFEEPTAMEWTFCQQLSAKQYAETVTSETDKALGELCLLLDKHPELYANILRKRKRDEIEDEGVFSFMKSKVLGLVHGQEYLANLVSDEDCLRKTDSLKTGICRTFQQAEELKKEPIPRTKRQSSKNKSIAKKSPRSKKRKVNENVETQSICVPSPKKSQLRKSHNFTEVSLTVSDDTEAHIPDTTDDGFVNISLSSHHDLDNLEHPIISKHNSDSGDATVSPTLSVPEEKSFTYSKQSVDTEDYEKTKGSDYVSKQNDDENMPSIPETMTYKNSHIENIQDHQNKDNDMEAEELVTPAESKSIISSSPSCSESLPSVTTTHDDMIPDNAASVLEGVNVLKSKSIIEINRSTTPLNASASEDDIFVTPDEGFGRRSLRSKRDIKNSPLRRKQIFKVKEMV